MQLYQRTRPLPYGNVLHMLVLVYGLFYSVALEFLTLLY